MTCSPPFVPTPGPAPELPLPFPTAPRSPRNPRFELGQVVATPGALDLLERAQVLPAGLLARHAGGDWGDLCPSDAAANEQALVDGSRLVSSYRLTIGSTVEKVWVITEAVGHDGRRASTTLLRPEDY